MAECIDNVVTAIDFRHYRQDNAGICVCNGITSFRFVGQEVRKRMDAYVDHFVSCQLDNVFVMQMQGTVWNIYEEECGVDVTQEFLVQSTSSAFDVGMICFLIVNLLKRPRNEIQTYAWILRNLKSIRKGFLKLFDRLYRNFRLVYFRKEGAADSRGHIQENRIGFSIARETGVNREARWYRLCGAQHL